MLIVIRISGMVDVPDNVQATLDHMRLRRKYSAVLLEDTSENIKLLRLIRDFVAFGKISSEHLSKLISLRGQALKSKNKNPNRPRGSGYFYSLQQGTLPRQSLGVSNPVEANKIDAKIVIAGLDKKSLIELGLKPFFRLHPPRGGIESKKHFGVGKGVLGDNGENINKLLERML